MFTEVEERIANELFEIVANRSLSFEDRLNFAGYEVITESDDNDEIGCLAKDGEVLDASYDDVYQLLEKMLSGLDDIEAIMADGKTESAAKDYIKAGTVVYSGLDENLSGYAPADFYGEESEEADKYFEQVKQMVKTGKPLNEWWGIVNKYGKTYYINYAVM